MKTVVYYNYTDSRPLDNPVDGLEYFKKILNKKNVQTLEEIRKKHQHNNDLVVVALEFWLDREVLDNCTQTYGRPHAVMNTFYTRIDLDTDIPVHLIPLDFSIVTREMSKYATVDSHQVSTVKSFNFMINRKRINRHLLIKLLEHFGLIGNSEYTWSGVDTNFDLSRICKELDLISAPWAAQIRSTMLTPIKTQSRWVKTESDSINLLSNVRTLNAQAWDQGLNCIFNDSAVSLISESIDYQNGIGFTEKSAYPLLGLNLPIWVGGKYQAEEFEKLGFDVFNDYIDHRYQYCDSLMERCYRAVADNYKILSDVDVAADIRQKAMPRLLNNRQVFLNTIQDEELHYEKAMFAIEQLDATDSVKDAFKLLAAYTYKTAPRITA